MTIFTPNGLMLVPPDLEPSAYFFALQLHQILANAHADLEDTQQLAWMSEELEYD